MYLDVFFLSPIFYNLKVIMGVIDELKSEKNIGLIIIATEKIENFKWLDHERKIQQITFGNKIKLTANFSDKTYNKITPKTIEVEWLNNGKKEYYTP